MNPKYPKNYFCVFLMGIFFVCLNSYKILFKKICVKRGKNYMWKIIDYSKEYFSEMIEMTTENYGKNNDISNNDFIEHEYFSDPAGDAYVKYAYDFEKSTMAGQYIVLPRDYCINGKIYKSVLSLNTLTRETYRGQQIFTKLAEAIYSNCKDDGIMFCYGAPNPNSFPGFMKKLSFTNLGYIPLYLKIRNPLRIVFDILHVPYKHSDKLWTVSSKKNDIEIVEITKVNVDLLDVFWKEIKDKYSVIGMRNADYFIWRYIDLPRRDYAIYLAKKDGKPCGYIVGRITEVAGMRCGMIVDFLFKKGEYLVGESLLDEVIESFKKAKIGLIGSLMHSHTEEGQILHRKGFFICPKRFLPQPFPIIYRQFNSFSMKDNDTINDFRNWFFTMGDYDVI